MKDRDVTAEDRLTVLFQPDTLLPIQYFDRLRRRTEYNGERRLLIAVLEDAVDVYRKQAGAHDARAKALFRDAEMWIEDLDCTWLFSFQNICDVLDLDAEYIRRGLRVWKARALAGHLPPSMVTLETDDRDDSDLRQASGALS
jgi:hypothetical protein